MCAIFRTLPAALQEVSVRLVRRLTGRAAVSDTLGFEAVLAD